MSPLLLSARTRMAPRANYRADSIRQFIADAEKESKH